MSKTQDLQIKNKYTGEVIRTIPADTKETLRAKIKKVQSAFPQYEVIGISAKYGNNIDKFYEALFAVAG